MAWTIAIVLATLGLSFILLFLNNSFDRSKQAIKVFLVMLTFGSMVLMAQLIKLIINDKASGDTLTNLQKLSTTSLTITITLFSFFVAFFLIFYTVDIIRSLRDAKKNKITEAWGDI